LQHFLLRALRSVQIESDEGPRFDVGALFRPTEDAPPVAQPTLLADEEKRARLLAAAQKAEQEDEDWDAEEELTTQDLARQLLR
jgi:hypothetical protein